MVDPQTMPLVDITGTYYPNTKAKNSTSPFIVKNAWLTPQQMDTVTHLPNFSTQSPGHVWTNLLWGIMPFLLLSAPFWLMALGILFLLYHFLKRNRQ